MAAPSKDVIEDVTTRFVLTAPEEQLRYFESLMFLVEQAHWYYEDYIREQDPKLKSYNLAAFTRLVFDTCPELKHYAGDVEVILERFKAFKKNVPVMGGILLDQSMERVLLVKGWKSAACWGFPRGKINTNETDMECAVREVIEETGLDLEGQMREEDVIEITLEGKRNKLYIVAGVDPDSTQFAPKCKGEIGGYAWHRITDLPKNKEEGLQQYVAPDGSKHKFYMVWPYMKPLRKWIQKRRMAKPQWDMPNQAQQQPQKHALMGNGSSRPEQQGAAAPQLSGLSGSTTFLGPGMHEATSMSTLGSSSSVDSNASFPGSNTGGAGRPFQFNRSAVMHALVNIR